MKKFFKQTKEAEWKKKILTKSNVSIGIILILIFTVILVSFFMKSEKGKYFLGTSQENQRAMNYEQFVDGDEAVYKDGTQGTGNEEIIDNIKFSSFFLRDLDSDGYAEKLKGTCKEIGKEDTLYMEIIVQTAGYLKDGKIEIDGKNFYFQTTLPKDNELKSNYIGNNIKTIEFENLNNGTQKMLTGVVRSGDYTYDSQKTIAIGNNINNYSRNDNKIIFTGTYVDEEENELAIRKEIPITMDWYGTATAKIYTRGITSDGTQTYYDIENRIDEENETLTLNFGVYPQETKKDLNINYNYLEGTIPELNGYVPISVTLTNGTGEFTYDESTRKFVITKNAIVGDDGKITSSITSNLSYEIKAVYPLEAYTVLDNEDITINIPVKTYFYGYNNPNSEFQNPYISNTATATIIANFRKPVEERSRIDIKVGKYISDPYLHYMISKKKPLRIYNGLSAEETEDYYTVSWHISTGTVGEYEKLVLKENKNVENTKVDTFVKSDSTEESMEDITSNVGIYFFGANNLLKEDGEIKVYDVDTDNLLVTFTKDGTNGTKKWSAYTNSNPYYYDVPVKHIRIETTSTNSKSSMYVYNIKELDDDIITAKFEREEFDNLKYIKSNLSVYAGENLLGSTTHQAVYEEPYSISNISISKNTLSTQVTEENFKIYIDATQNEANNQIGWTNGTYLVKLPSEILSTEINSVEVNNSKVNILSYEVIEKDGHNFIKIKTSNQNPESYKITIDSNITPDPRIATVSKKFELYAVNEETENYYYNMQDLYDVNDNGNTQELVNYRDTSISLVSPNSLLTNQTISDFDETGTVIISPQVVDLKPIYSENDREPQTVKIGVQMKNNYSSTISEACILGKIPFEGNSYVVSGRDLNSEFTTEMSDTGIEVPEELKNKVTIYYSENENPSKDLNDTENGWTLKENVTDFSKIKTYLIDLEDTIINVGAEYTFYYTAKIPFGIEFNKIAYSHHGIYFSLDTPEGKYRTSTEPNKIGVRIADKYNLELTKYQMRRDKKVEGATYKVSKLSDSGEVESTSTAITNAEGKLEMANLYAEKVYEIKEIDTPDNYELSGDVIGVIGHINRTNGVLTIEKIYGETRDEITVQKNEGEDYKAKINVEDEVRGCLKIIKTDKDTSVPVKGAKFKITGPGVGTSGRIIKTNSSGEVSLNRIRVGMPYTIEETKAEGYYLASPITFKIVNNNETYESEIIDGDVKLDTVTLENDFPILNLEIEDEAIPRYNLEITKIKHVTEVEEGNGGNNNQEVTYLQGAKFKLYKDGKELGTYITDENGKLSIENLYIYEESKGVDQTYVLKEVLAPEGYTKVKDITFKVSNILGVLNYEETLEEGQSEKDYTIEGNTVKLTVEDNPTFKLVKKDAETDELLPNTKFAIYNVNNEIVPARNSKGEIIGEKEIINGQEYYTVTTDNNGEITLDLPEGLYKAVEVEASDEKYEIGKQGYYFGIGANNEETSMKLLPEWGATVGDEYNDKINCVLELSDGSVVAGGMRTYNNGKTQFEGIIVRYKEDGEKIWETTVGNEINSFIETTDGNIVFGGRANYYSYHAYNILDGSLIGKISISGELIWTSCSESVNNGTGYYHTKAYIYDVVETDGGYIAVGKFSGKNLKIDNYTIENHMRQEYSGNYYDDEGFIVKYSSNGEIQNLIGIGNGYIDSLNSIVATDDGGYLVGGHFSDTITLGEYTLTSNGSSDGMLIKYNSEGNVEWVKQVGNETAVSLSTIDIGTNGDYVIGGYFRNSLIIGDYTLTSNGGIDIMFIKYNTNGEVEWATSIGSTLDDTITDISATEEGGFLISGYFKGNNLLLDKFQLSNIYNVQSGFLAKYSSNNIVEWATNTEESTNNGINTIIEAENGDYIIGGYFNTKLNFYDFSLTSNSNSQDGVIIRFNELEERAILKAKRAIDISGNNIAYDVTSDGGYIVSGTFSKSMSVGEYELTNNGSLDGLIIKYSQSGEVEWAKSLGGEGEDSLSVVKETLDGGYIVGGYFRSKRIVIDGHTIEDANDNTNGFANVMIIKLNYDGEIEWTKSINGKWDDSIDLIELTSDRGYILGGVFKSESLNIDNFTIYNHENSGSLNKGDVFIIKLNSEGNTVWMNSVGGTSYDEINVIEETSDEGYLVAEKFCYNVTVNNITYTNINTEASYNDILLIKYSKFGEIEWTKQIGAKGNDWIKSIIRDKNGENVLLGYSTAEKIELDDEYILEKEPNKSIVIKYDNNGNLLYANSILENLSKFKKVDDGYIAIDSYIIYKYDDNFNVLWRKKISSMTLRDINVKNGIYSILSRINNNSVTVDDVTIDSTGIIKELILELKEQKAMTDTQELIIENPIKEYKITTDVNEIDGVKGGAISGEDLYKYEEIKYNESSTKEIKITPDENYEIISITVNNKEWKFEAEADGSYTMPQFENMLEDKHIVATFAKKDNKIIINKVDSNNGNALQGAKFKLDQIEERNEPEIRNILGNLTDNGQSYFYANTENEITGVLGELTNNGTYYFVEQNDGNGNISYVPTNSKTWQVANVDGMVEGVQNSTANSYIPIDLSGLEGYYKVVVNAECSSQASNDYGFVRVNDSTGALTYSWDFGKFVYISGNVDAKDYESTVVLEGGKTYYLHFGYYKNGSTDDGDDQFKVNSFKVYGADEVKYNFIENDGKYESTNQGKDSTVCNSYIPIDLSTSEGKYNLIVNAEISSQNSYDYGYITIKENTDRPVYSNSTGRIVYISGTQLAKDYETVLEGGKTYYLHMGYYKNDLASSGGDTFTINSINLILNDSDLYHTTVETNSEGQAITQAPFGKYAITEVRVPDGYVLDSIPTVVEFRESGEHEFTIENDKICNVIVHHYIKDTTTKVAEDDLLQGKEGEEYSTIPKIDLLNYEQEKDENDEYIMPDNYSGEFTYENKEVTYYYVPKGTLLTVHHYIEGTETEVPLKDGSLAETEYYIGNKGTSYQTNSLTNEELSDYYVYSRVEGESTGVYGDNEIIVTYYYKKAQNTLTINKYDEDGVTPLEGAEFRLIGKTDNIVLLEDMTNNGTYYFEKQGNKYISNNQGKGNTVANSYIKIDMTSAKTNAKVIVNAEISSQSSYDIGYVTLTETEFTPYYSTSSGRFVYISGTVPARDYEATLERGKVYYLHFGYRKNGNTNTGADIFTINGLRIEGVKVAPKYITNNLGKIEEIIDTGEYEIREIKAPYGYITPDDTIQTVSISKYNSSTVNITNQRKTGRVIVHHYKEGTAESLAEDDIIEKKVFEEYTTSVKEKILNKYTLVLEPTNKTGTIKEEDTVVTYYYRRITGNLKINKVDKDTNNPIEGVEFGIYEGDYGKVTLEDGKKVGNVYNKVTADKTDESNIEPELFVHDRYPGFENVDGKYVSAICKWYTSNRDNTYQDRVWSNAILNIYLEDKSEDEYFVLTANVEMVNTTNVGELYVNFTNGYMGGNWIELKEDNNSNYEIALRGGINYQLSLEYDKTNNVEVEDYVAIEMKLYNAENGRVDIINEVPSYATLNNLGEEENIELSVNKQEWSTFAFVEKDGKYIPNNCQLYADENGTNSGDWAESYFEIDLTNKEGYYGVVVNAETSGFSGDEGLYSCISENLNWTYNFIEVYEDTNATDYYQLLKGGKKYYLLVEYGKDSGEDVKDYASINSIKLYKADVTETEIGFDKTPDGMYVSNIQGQNNTIAHSVIPIDLRDKEETVELTVNAEISSEEWNDYGYVYVTDVFNLNDHADYWYTLISISGEVNAQDYTLELEGGKLYYLHFIFEKNDSDYNDVGTDTFTINSVKVETPRLATLTTNSEGLAEITLPTNDYTILELAPKEGYEGIEPQKITLTKDGLYLTIENEKIKGKVIVKHLLEGTEENITNYDDEEIEPELKKGLYGEEFETEPRDDLNEKYELVEMPNETSGEFEEQPQTITYYYRIKKYPYIVNYLLKDDDDDDTNNTVLSTQKAENITFDYGTIINSEDEVIDIDGYAFDSLNIDNLKITGHGNVINVYYHVATKDLKYTVEYYKDGEIQDDDTQEGKVTVEVTKPDTIEVEKEKINIENKYEHYKLDKIMLKTINEDTGEIEEKEIDELPDTVNNEDIIKVFYKKASYKYTVEYYFDNVKDENLTEEKEEVYGKVITEYEDKVKDGYRLKETPLPIQITENEPENVMKVYYVIDDKDTKELTYKVEYYKDGEEVISDSFNHTITVQVLEDDTIIVDKDEINTEDKYEYYKLEKIMLNDEVIDKLPEEVEDEDIIKIYYEKKDSTIVVKYVDKDGEELQEETTISGKVLDKFDLDTINDKIEGYEIISKTKDGEIEFVEEETEVVFTYLKKTKVIVNYIDKETEEVMEREEIEGLDGDDYLAEEKAFEEYDLVEEMYPENVEGKMTKEIITVNFYYMKKVQEEPEEPEEPQEQNEPEIPEEKKEAKVIVKYLEVNTNKVLADEVIITGKEGDHYQTSEKILREYSFLKIEGTKEGTMKEGETVIIYYYTMIRVDQGVPEHRVDLIEKETKREETNNPNVIIVKSNTPENTNTIDNNKIDTTTKEVKSGDELPVIAVSVIIVIIMVNIVIIIVKKKTRKDRKHSNTEK